MVRKNNSQIDPNNVILENYAKFRNALGTLDNNRRSANKELNSLLITANKLINSHLNPTEKKQNLRTFRGGRFRPVTKAHVTNLCKKYLVKLKENLTQLPSVYTLISEDVKQRYPQRNSYFKKFMADWEGNKHKVESYRQQILKEMSQGDSSVVYRALKDPQNTALRQEAITVLKDLKEDMLALEIVLNSLNYD